MDGYLCHDGATVIFCYERRIDSTLRTIAHFHSINCARHSIVRLFQVSDHLRGGGLVVAKFPRALYGEEGACLFVSAYLIEFPS